jgi:WD40 repeat protein
MVAFSPDGRWLVASGGEGVPVFDTRTWKRAVTLAALQVSSLSFDPTGPRLAIATQEGDASIWAIPTGAYVQHLHETGERISRVAFSPDGQYVVTASLGGAERVWNAKTGRQQVELKNHRTTVLSVAFDPSSRQVVSAGADGLVVISDVATGMPVSSLEGAGGTVTDARFDPTSRLVIAASWDGTARVWEAPAPYRRWSSLPIDDDCGTDASLEADSRFVAISCKQRGTHVWDTARDLLLAELPGVTPAGNDFEPAFPAVSAEGDRAAIATDNTVTIYGLPGGDVIRKVVHPAKVNAVAFARAGHDLVTASVDGSLLVTQDGREPRALPAFPGGVDVAGFAPDGRVIVAGAAGKLRVYDPVHATIIAELALPIRARSFRMSSDGRRMLVVPTDTKPAPAVLWDLEHPQIVARLEGHVGQVFSARFVRGDRQILTAGADGIARLWDSGTGELKMAYFGSNPFLLDAILDPTGTMVITAGGDGVLRFFDAASKDLIWTLRAHKTTIAGLHFEDRYLVTRSFNGEVSRWELPALPSSPPIEELLRCLPLKFDDATGSLTAQLPCDFSVR